MYLIVKTMFSLNSKLFLSLVREFTLYRFVILLARFPVSLAFISKCVLLSCCTKLDSL